MVLRFQNRARERALIFFLIGQVLIIYPVTKRISAVTDLDMPMF